MSALDHKKSVILDVKKTPGQIEVKLGTKKTVAEKVASALKGEK